MSFADRKKVEAELERERQQTKQNKAMRIFNAAFAIQRAVKRWRRRRAQKMAALTDFGASGFRGAGEGAGKDGALSASASAAAAEEGSAKFDDDEEGEEEEEEMVLAAPSLFGCLDFVNMLGIQAFTGLRSLSLRGSCLGLKAATLHTICDNLSSLRYLDLSGVGPSPASDIDAQHVVLLAKLRHLQVLELCCWPVTESSLVAFCEACAASETSGAPGACAAAEGGREVVLPSEPIAVLPQQEEPVQLMKPVQAVDGGLGAEEKEIVDAMPEAPGLGSGSSAGSVAGPGAGPGGGAGAAAGGGAGGARAKLRLRALNLAEVDGLTDAGLMVLLQTFADSLEDLCVFGGRALTMHWTRVLDPQMVLRRFNYAGAYKVSDDKFLPVWRALRPQGTFYVNPNAFADGIGIEYTKQ